MSLEIRFAHHMWEGLAQDRINKAVTNFSSSACLTAGCRWWPLSASVVRACPSPSLHPYLSTKKLAFSEPPTYWWRKQRLKR